MSLNNLEYLCAGFCEIAKVATPELREAEGGIVAFSLHWQGVNVDVMARPASDPHHAFVLFDLGIPDAARAADPVRVLLALLHANFLAMRASQPVFSCHPVTHAAVLQWAFALQDSTPAQLHQAIEEGIRLALQWRETLFLPQSNDEGAPAPSDGQAFA